MRRIAVVVPLVFAAGLLAGCSQVAQVAGDALGVDVQATCTTIDDAYAQYQTLLDQGGASAEQVDAARDQLVATLDGLAADVDGKLGDVIASGAQQIGNMTDLQAPETIEAVDRLKDSLSAFCG
jgi:predicted small secreted protein